MNAKYNLPDRTHLASQISNTIREQYSIDPNNIKLVSVLDMLVDELLDGVEAGIEESGWIS